jgi:hypothetical protein
VSDLIVFETGTPQIRPYFTVFETAVSDILRLDADLAQVVS